MQYNEDNVLTCLEDCKITKTQMKMPFWHSVRITILPMLKNCHYGICFVVKHLCLQALSVQRQTGTNLQD